MRLARLIIGAFFILYGAFRLYRAFQIHGDSTAYLLGSLCVVVGVVFFVKFAPKSQQ